MKKDVILVGFYNEKALGVRYLYNALKENGFNPHIIFFKGFSSNMPEKATERELELLQELIASIDPLFVGLSVMSSLYLETTHMVNKAIRKKFNVPILWGGVYATLEPGKALEYCDYVMRGEGEDTIVEVSQALEQGKTPKDIKNVSYLDIDGELIQNEIRPIGDIDRFGYPPIGGDNLYLIHGNECKRGDPQLSAFTYELCASRGCPFTCSYCSAINLRRLYAGKGKYVRFRSVDSVIKELLEAKKKISKLRVVHFWDEIFSDAPGWVEEFSKRYKAEIGIPFRVWGHPLKTSERVISNLVDAGLHQIVVGIQSGSISVRKDTFNRHETQEEIIACSKVLSKCKVPKVYYDFMLCHPFENLDQLKETFELCMKLEPPFMLNVHGLNFLPSTDIVQMAIEQGKYTPQQMEGMMYSTIQEQYDQYWGPNARSFQAASDSNVWIALIRLTQFHKIKDKVSQLAKKVEQGQAAEEVFALVSKMEKRQKLSNLADKAKLVLKIK